MLVRPVLEMGCLASLPDWLAGESKRIEMDEIRTLGRPRLEVGRKGNRSWCS